MQLAICGERWRTMEPFMRISFRNAPAFVLTVFVAGALSLGVALAAGEGGGNSDNAGNNKPKCKQGQVLENGKCVDAASIKKPDKQKQGLIYDHGKSLAKAGEYELAIATFKLAPDQNDPRLLNYMGYSHRKLGRMDEALAYYHAAIARDPDFSLVREYLGEAYIQLGMLEQARAQLTEIERICGGRDCSEYGQLAEMMVVANGR
jgi:tetratricopeptide (TPR) repeat protein